MESGILFFEMAAFGNNVIRFFDTVNESKPSKVSRCLPLLTPNCCSSGKGLPLISFILLFLARLD